MDARVESYTDQLERFLRSNLTHAHLFAFYFVSIFLSAYFMSSILRPEIFTDDMVEWTSWAYSFQDPDLFPNDIHKNYWMTNFPLGYEVIPRHSCLLPGRLAAFHTDLPYQSCSWGLYQLYDVICAG